MDRSMLRLRVSGVPLDIRWSWLVFAVVFGMLIHGVDALLVPWVALATVAVLVHEAGHAAVVLAAGGSPHVVLHGSGGMTIGPNLGARQNFLLAAAGPAVGFVVGGLALGLVALLPADALPTLLIDDLVLVTMGWSALNLLPLAGLDGRLALDSLVTVMLGRPAPDVGRVVGTFLLVALLLATALAGQYMATFLVGFIALATALPLGGVGRWLGAGGPAGGPGLLIAGRAAEALAWADVWLERHPGDIDVTLVRAEALRALTRWPEAVSAYDQVLDQNASSWPALAGRSLAHRALDELERARADQAVLVAAAEADPAAIAPAAVALWGDRRYAQAARLLDDAFARPDLAGPVRGSLDAIRAAIHSAQAEPEQALAMSDERLVDAPDDLGAHEVRAHALLQLGLLREARRSASRALAGAPTHPELLETMAIIERISGEPDAALPVLIDAGAARPNLPRARAELAMCFIQLGRIDEAVAALQGLENAADADPHVMYARACLLAREGRVADAASVVARAASILPALARIADQDPLLRDLAGAPAAGPTAMQVAALPQ
ncbi:MAG: tetratricopeptide repeat protein [Candidatus Limnocylindrales bacterium]